MYLYEGNFIRKAGSRNSLFCLLFSIRSNDASTTTSLWRHSSCRFVQKRKKWGSMSSWNLDFVQVYIPILNHYIRSKYLDSNSHTCWTSAVVDRKSSMYLDPMFSLCFRSAFSASSSSANNTKASPVARPSGFLTNKIPSSPSTNEQVCSPREKNSI